MRRAHQIAFVACFLALISAVPLWQAAIEMARGRRPQFLDVFTRNPTRENLRAFERQMEESSVVARAARPWIQYAWYTLLANAGEKVVVGREGWLFYKPDVRYLVEPAAEDPFAAIVSFRDQLARRGIRLMVLPVPGKPSVYPDKLTTRAGDGPAPSPTLRLMRRLERAGIETPNLFQAFADWRERRGGPFYLLRDTHWSGEAARLAAELVARRVRALGCLPPHSVAYRLRPVTVRRSSDIVRMIRVPGIEWHYPAEQVRCDQVLCETGELYRDDAASPVLVLGDSFLRIYQTDEPRAAGFIAHLARELGFPVASVVNDGGASTLVRLELARRPGLLAGKKVVIWEFVERDIRFGTEGWKEVPLPATSQ